MNENIKYCNTLTEYSRFSARIVNIGNVPLGGNHPVRIQSMTTTDTLNTKATVEQCIRIIEAGADYVRITAPSLKEAQNLEVIKKDLRKKGFETPLIADIHFTPNAAELAARIVEKVRVNPGNYADKKKFAVREYSDDEYLKELERIRERFIPLVKICKEHGTAMRIGTNHGSLSDRIMNRYGDTPMGMVESALEFVRICEDEGYHDIVLSMKSSNPVVMIQAYRLLVNKMIAGDMNYPLHLGVTEAGEGEDGRIKSAIGIGALLEDGLGDTIRVSLTENPEFEVPVALALVSKYDNRSKHNRIMPIDGSSLMQLYSPFEYKKRKTGEVLNIGASNAPVVIADFSSAEEITPERLKNVGYKYSAPLDKWTIADNACDYLFQGKNRLGFKIPGTLGVIYDFEIWSSIETPEREYPLFQQEGYVTAVKKSAIMNFVIIDISQLNSNFINIVSKDKTAILVFETKNLHGMAEQRRMFFELINNNCHTPVIVKRNYNDDADRFLLHASTDTGALFIDGLGDGIWVCSTKAGSTDINNCAFGILQATRTRISKTEYISCPSCGRTLFDLQETTAKIRARTNHLKGIKIAIMGCIVNGPGEMADADYGYVGTGAGKISLYKGKEMIRRNIPSEQAVDALIELIREHGDWVTENSPDNNFSVVSSFTAAQTDKINSR